MKARVLDPRRLDVVAAATDRAELSGETPLTEMGRLVEGGPAPAAGERVTWSARFDLRPVRGGDPEPGLQLQARTRVQRECQRCLQPVAIDLAVDRTLRFAADEAAAEALDADSEEDVLALDRRFDLLALVEDELLMALPLVPRHEVCDEPLPSGAAAGGAGDSPAEQVASHPFAVLAGLKPRGSA